LAGAVFFVLCGSGAGGDDAFRGTLPAPILGFGRCRSGALGPPGLRAFASTPEPIVPARALLAGSDWQLGGPAS